MEHENDPYAEGVEAAHTGKMMADCPYQYGTPDGDKWCAGYEDGGGEE